MDQRKNDNSGKTSKNNSLDENQINQLLSHAIAHRLTPIELLGGFDRPT